MPDWLVTTLWIVGGVLVVFFVGGMLLPRDFKVARSIVIAAPPEKIHPHIDSLAKWPAWSPFDTEDPTIVWEKSDQTAGVGAKRSWKSKKMGDGSQWITASDPKTGVEMKLVPVTVKGCAAPVATGCDGLTEVTVGVGVVAITEKVSQLEAVDPFLTRTRQVLASVPKFGLTS